jgi:hypothetical protein
LTDIILLHLKVKTVRTIGTSAHADARNHVHPRSA